ncbi:exodeoxyribonuclease VII small subunit [Pandoraea apista]|uniref:exodeoxyribonuclease VII small subunit n=1 Tax=Pandoraea apista TaxID=93218 RepID=UPI000CE99763|nr:exodeoxyribonuclease VII small subunit [Pandoraea apista]AVF41447.1 exodeoxyribonuclease VII small subunit [Pandoraea apista]
MAKTVKSQDAVPEVPQDLPETYEAALAELEKLVARMEGGELGLEESLGAYRRGAVLVKYCQGLLEKVEQQVKVLEGETLKPLEAARDDF